MCRSSHDWAPKSPKPFNPQPSALNNISIYFGFFGHPEVYILIIPAFGIISIIIFGFLQLLIFGNQSMIFAMSSISLLGSLVWGHRMYSVGLESDTRAYFAGVKTLMSLPTGTTTLIGFLHILEIHHYYALELVLSSFHISSY